MRTYKCSCGSVLHSLGSVRNHIRYHKKYDPYFIVYRIKCWQKFLWCLYKNWKKISSFIGYLLIFTTIVTHEQGYNILEMILIGLGIGFLVKDIR